MSRVTRQDLLQENEDLRSQLELIRSQAGYALGDQDEDEEQDEDGEDEAEEDVIDGM